MNIFEDDKILIVKGIHWLNKNLWAKDLEIDKSDGLAFKYANNQNRVVQRTLNFINQDKESLQWLHDFLMRNGKSLEKEIFVAFFKLWNRKARIDK